MLETQKQSSIKKVLVVLRQSNFGLFVCLALCVSVCLPVSCWPIDSAAMAHGLQMSPQPNQDVYFCGNVHISQHC